MRDGRLARTVDAKNFCVVPAPMRTLPESVTVAGSTSENSPAPGRIVGNSLGSCAPPTAGITSAAYWSPATGHSGGVHVAGAGATGDPPQPHASAANIQHAFIGCTAAPN